MVFLSGTTQEVERKTGRGILDRPGGNRYRSDERKIKHRNQRICSKITLGLAAASIFTVLIFTSCATVTGDTPQVTTVAGGIAKAPFFEETPEILLLAVPVSKPEPSSFGIPPEPSIPAAFRATGKQLPAYTDALAEIDPKDSQALLNITALPEPVLPREEVASTIPEKVEETHTEDIWKTPAKEAVIETTTVSPQPEIATVTTVDTSPPAKPTAVTVTAVIPPSDSGYTMESPAEAPVETQIDEHRSYAREITAAVAEKIPLSFEGRGWIFTGSDSGEDGIAMKSRRITANETVFEFDPIASGEYTLNFQFQDNFTGSVLAESVALKVTEQYEESEVISDQIQYDGEVFVLTETPKTVAAAVENPLAAIPALDEIFSSLGQDDQEALDHIARWYKEAGYTREYVACLEKYLEVYPTQRGNDYRYYELGMIYESEDFRNEKKARYYYAVIVDAFPASLYYTDAVGRVRYLDRHFLDLR